MRLAAWTGRPAVARVPSDDRPATGAIEGLQDSIAREVPADDPALPDADRNGSQRDQTVSDRNRTPSTPTDRMSTIDAAAVFDACREQLQELLGDHADITIVEHAIASYPLDDEEKAALWLWATAPFDPATLSFLQTLDGA